MDHMTGEELRLIDQEEFKDKDIVYTSPCYDPHTGVVVYCYNIGLSVLEKNNTKHCLLSIQGPKYKSPSSNYENKEQYHKALTAAIFMLRKGYCNISEYAEARGERENKNISGSVTCPFS